MTTLIENENHCNFCKAEFKEGALNKLGKCFKCEELWPNVENKKDLDKDETDKENEGRLKNVILKEIEAFLLEKDVLLKCVCGKSYFKRSPAQKSCGCQNTKGG